MGLVREIPIGIGVALMLIPSAAAYLDPGTGAVVWQVLVSSFLGVAFAVKLFWRRIKNFFLGIFGRAAHEP